MSYCDLNPSLALALYILIASVSNPNLSPVNPLRLSQ